MTRTAEHREAPAAMTPDHVRFVDHAIKLGVEDHRHLMRDVLALVRSQVSGDLVSVPRIYGEILAERERQDRQWGGSSHDDDHGFEDWARFRSKFEQRLLNLAWASPFDGKAWYEGTRDSLIKMAALAVAQIESLDRGNAPAPSLPSAGTKR